MKILCIRSTQPMRPHRRLQGWHDDQHDSHGKLYVEYVVVLPDQMEGGMEKEFWGVWEKWRKKNGVNLLKDSGRPDPVTFYAKDEL